MERLERTRFEVETDGTGSFAGNVRVALEGPIAADSL